MAFEKAHPEMYGASYLFGDISDEIHEIVEAMIGHKFVCFFEYLGPNSFAGTHKPEDQKELVLIDVEVDGVMLPPEDFLSNFSGGGFKVARVVYRGKLTGKFTEDVRKGKYNVAEGVVCKGLDGKWMAKVKTDAYMEKLKAFDPKNWQQYWE
jgi:hypothetical protein